MSLVDKTGVTLMSLDVSVVFVIISGELVATKFEIHTVAKCCKHAYMYVTRCIYITSHEYTYNYIYMSCM